MFKKKFIVIFLLICLIFTFPLTAHADFGPKPSVTVNFEGLEDTEYYATLLSQISSTGPWSAENRRDDMGEEQPIWDKFAEYQDEDGYYFLNFLLEKVNDNSFRWGYYPPSTFKILIYIPQSDTFICSETLTSNAFHGVFKATVDLSQITLGTTNVSSIDVQERNIWSNILSLLREIYSFLLRAVITIVVEILLALAFGFRAKKQIIVILFANLITQVLLNLALSVYIRGYYLFILVYALLEVAVMAAEALIYVKKVRPLSEKSPQNKVWFIVVYTIVANLLSFALGYGLATLFPFLG